MTTFASVGVEFDDVGRLADGHAEPLPLTDRELADAGVVADDLAFDRFNDADRFRTGPTTLDETMVIAVGDETDFLAVGLLRNAESVLFRDRADSPASAFRRWERSLASESRSRARTESSSDPSSDPANAATASRRPPLPSAGVMAGGDGVGADRLRVIPQLAELQPGVADDARVRRAGLQVFVDEVILNPARSRPRNRARRTECRAGRRPAVRRPRRSRCNSRACGSASVCRSNTTSSSWTAPVRMKTPTTSCPCSLSSTAATELSTPPLIASTTRIGFVELLGLKHRITREMSILEHFAVKAVRGAAARKKSRARSKRRISRSKRHWSVAACGVSGMKPPVRLLRPRRPTISVKSALYPADFVRSSLFAYFVRSSSARS